MPEKERIRVLYSFPHKIGAGGICYAAWNHVKYHSINGVEVFLHAGVCHRNLPDSVHVHETLKFGNFRLPYKLLGRVGACMVHDKIVSRRLRNMTNKVDIVHCFPLGALETIQTAKKMGIPTVIERCNAHTRYAYDVVESECRKCGVGLPKGHPHLYNETVLAREEQEYEAADYIMCPSDFVVRTFEQYGFPAGKLIRFRYGCNDDCHIQLGEKGPNPTKGLITLFAANCAPRKGLHYALEAWCNSSASNAGKLLIIGEFIPGYAEKLGHYLKHPGIEMLGYREDLIEIMRNCDLFVLPTIEEGSALVTYDARAAGCVLLVSDASGAVCKHGVNALVHRVGDVETLACHFTALDKSRDLLNELRKNSIATSNDLTWLSASRHMNLQYKHMINSYKTPS